MRARSLALSVALAAQVFAGAAYAQSLADLLREVQSSRAAEAKLNASREAEFKQARDQQTSLMAEATRKRNAAEATSASLSARYVANEITINENNELLRQRQGNLGELFGVTRQIAGEVANALDASIINTRFSFSPSAFGYCVLM